MFDYDDEFDSAGGKTTISFEYRRYAGDYEQLEMDVSRYIRNEQAEFLPQILDAFKQFLVGIGFTYVEEVVAVKETGGECSSAEVIF